MLVSSATTSGATRRRSWLYPATLSGLAGGLFAMAQASAFPDVMSLHYSGYVVMMTLVGGGLVSFWGPRASVPWPSFLHATSSDHFTTGLDAVVRPVVCGALVLFKPEGIAGMFAGVMNGRDKIVPRHCRRTAIAGEVSHGPV